jgi:hypothetical protein
VTLQEFCFRGKIVAGGAELRRLLALKAIQVNGIASDSGDIEIKNGDIIQKGKRLLFIKAATLQDGINIIPKDLSNNKTYRIITDQELDYSIIT